MITQGQISMKTTGIYEGLFFDEQRQKDETWSFLKENLPGIELKKTKDLLEVNRNTRQIDFEKTLALVQVANNISDKTDLLLSTEQLLNLAHNQSTEKKDIEEVPCVYIFLSLAEKLCIKVGQTNNARDRFFNGHFNITRNNEPSHLCHYYMRDWPESIKDEDVVAVIYPMYGSSENGRLAVESGLTAFLKPLMP